MSEKNILDLPLADFQAYLGEMRSNGRNTDDLVRMYRSHNSPFSAINSAADEYQQGLAESGRRPVAGGFLSKEAGTTGLDALKSVGFEGLGGLLGAGQALGQAFDAPYSAARNLIPQDDMSGEALGTAGLAMGGGGLAARPAGSVGMGASLNSKNMFHGTPDVRDLKKAGAFDQNTEGAQRISDFEEWQRLGQQIEDAGPTTPQGIDFAIARSKLLEQQRVNRPVFATPDRRTAATYADDTRAFDYQRAEPAIVSMKSSPQRILDVNAGGSDFRGISLERVKAGFREAGVTDAEMSDAINRYIVDPRADGKLSTNDLSAVSQSLGFDAVDVANVRDHYSNNSRATPETVRMLFDSNQIRIGDVDLLSNASQSGGLLGAGLSGAQRQARDILEMRADGRAGDVTDEMMALADDQYMFANTPLDMGEAARMARAEDAGFDTGTPLYHGTPTGGFDAFDADKFKWGVAGPGVYMGDSPDVAEGYLGPDAWNGIFAEDAQIYDNLVAGTRKGVTPAELTEGGGNLRQNANAVAYGAADDGYSGLDVPTRSGAIISTTIDPSNIRSRFARFDPEFAHLSNLSAANASPTAGLLASGAQNTDKPLPFMEMLRGLLR
jgi:hypothetical protein